jgi:hypothetical protein
MTNTPHSDSELDEILDDFHDEPNEEQAGCAVNWEDDCDCGLDEAKTALIQWADRRAEKLVVEAEKEWLIVYLTNALELYKGIRPARPEDLSMSQWHGLVEAIDTGITSIESELAALTATKEEGV